MTPRTSPLRDPDPLPARGSHQRTRMPAGLAPGYFLVDDKEAAEWVNYVAALSRHLAFTDTDGTRRGSWNDLYRNHPAVAAARLSGFPAERMARELSDLRERIEEVTATPTARRTLLGEYFQRLRDAATDVDEQVHSFEAGTELRRRGTAVISESLAPAYTDWLGYYLTAVTHGIADLPGGVADSGELRGDLEAELSGAWDTGSIPLPDDRLGVFGLEAPPADDDARATAAVHAVGHTFLNRITTTFVQQALHLRAAARRTFEAGLADGAGHAPHVALLLAYLRVRRHQRRAINGLTDRHLRFYYARVLQLRAAPASPREAYLVHELRKGANAVTLPAGTGYRGGKDDNGVERRFDSQSAVTVSHAVLTDLRALYLSDRIHAGLEANSRDGRGEKLPEGVESWFPFGYREGGSSRMPEAALGFAFGGEKLAAAAGLRTYTLYFDLRRTVSRRVVFRCAVTVEDGWFEVDGTLEEGAMEIVLPADVAPVVPYQEKTHGPGFGRDLPLIRCTLSDPTLAVHGILLRAELRLRDIRLQVSGLVEAHRPSGGIVKLSEPFYPFGPLPQFGDKFVLTLPEALRNEGTVNVELKESPVAAQIAAGGGVGRLVLRAEGSWRQRTYPVALAEALIEKANSEDPPSVPLPDPPPDPVIDRLELGYIASGLRPELLLRILPFGTRPVTADGGLFEALLPGNYVGGGDAGAVYLGFTQWEPGSQISLLFGIAADSADPEADKPDDHLHWDYLNGDQWERLEGVRIDDGTAGLLSTGTVRIDLPYETNLRNSRMGDGKTWIRISAPTAVAAVGYLRGIHPHAVRVRETFGEPVPETVASLPPDTVTRTVAALPDISRVGQPYGTFGGSDAEGRGAYFTRSSERLRHRGRGITPWDIERLVLGAFPEVERAVCLSHVRYGPGLEYHELAPGHVTLLPLGHSGGLYADELRPLVSLETRERIADYLAERMSCHVTLHVENPTYEGVKVTVTLSVAAGTDETWAAGDIDREIKDFLAPWRTDGLGALDFSGTVHRATLVDRLEELPYVTAVESMDLEQAADPAQRHRETLHPTRRTAVLTSAAEHSISIVGVPSEAGPCTCCTSPLTGLGPTTIELS